MSRRNEPTNRLLRDVPTTPTNVRVFMLSNIVGQILLIVACWVAIGVWKYYEPEMTKVRFPQFTAQNLSLSYPHYLNGHFTALANISNASKRATIVVIDSRTHLYFERALIANAPGTSLVLESNEFKLETMELAVTQLALDKLRWDHLLAISRQSKRGFLELRIDLKTTTHLGGFWQYTRWEYSVCMVELIGNPTNGLLNVTKCETSMVKD